MWRPVALSAFLALLFMTSRSVQPPIETDANEAGKGDLGAEAVAKGSAPASVKIDLARSSVHSKRPAASGSADSSSKKDGPASKVEAETDDDGPAGSVRTAALAIEGARTIPLPAPKTGDSPSGMRVVVTQGEEKTALTSGEDALSLMPPGPDFAAKVQKELARLGCYRGRVDNIWGPMSRNAVARFNRMAKAKLPVKQPTRALLSSARKAPDEYCAGGAVASGGANRVAALDPEAGAEALKDRPAYLPPWMRGEPMPEPDENKVTEQPEPEPDAKPEQAATRVAARQEPRATRTRASRAERRVRRSRDRRRVRRARKSFTQVLKNWPGQ